MYAKPRSVNADLRTGMHEGSERTPGKDWGGPHDARSCPPDADNDHGYLVDLPGVNR